MTKHTMLTKGKMLLYQLEALLVEELAEQDGDQTVDADHAPEFKYEGYFAQVLIHQVFESVDHRHPECEDISKWLSWYVVSEYSMLMKVIEC